MGGAAAGGKALRGIFKRLVDGLLKKAPKVTRRPPRELPARLATQLTTAQAKRRAAKAVARFRTEVLEAGGKRPPTVVTATVDRRTGRAYTGGAGERGIEVPPTLRDLLPNPSKEPWKSDNCAEVAAAARAIRDGSDLKDLVFISVTTKTGVLRALCNNCSSWIFG